MIFVLVEIFQLEVFLVKIDWVGINQWELFGKQLYGVGIVLEPYRTKLLIIQVYNVGRT